MSAVQSATSCTAECFIYIKGTSTLPFPGPSQSALVFCPAFGWHYVMHVEVRKWGAVLVAFPFINPAVCQWQIQVQFSNTCSSSVATLSSYGARSSLKAAAALIAFSIASGKLYSKVISLSFQFSLFWLNLPDTHNDLYDGRASKTVWCKERDHHHVSKLKSIIKSQEGKILYIFCRSSWPFAFRLQVCSWLIFR